MSTSRTDSAWPLPSADPEEMGFSPERLKRIDSFMQGYIDRQELPCMVTLVARHGKIVHLQAQGYMDFDSKTPVQTDTIFRLYSNTKPITSVATLILYEEGLLKLNDPISKYLPAFRKQMVISWDPSAPLRPDRNTGVNLVPARREVNIRDCLRHTTGFPVPGRLPLVYRDQYRDAMRQPTQRESMDKLAKIPLVFQPGTEFLYHVGFPVLGLVLEEIVGKSLEDFYRERIFGPLGMKDSAFYLPEEKLARFPTCYRPKPEGEGWVAEVADRPETSEKVKGPKIFFGAGGDLGGVLSTVSDYARFAQMLLNGGVLDGVRILGRKTVELMTSSHTGDILIQMTGPGTGHGLGVGVRTGLGGPPALRSVGGYGWGGAAGTGYFADPKEDLFGLCFTQMLGTESIGLTQREEFERLVYQALV